MEDILYIVVPCYNEMEVLPDSSKKLLLILEEMIEEKLISSKSRILLVDDGSKDKTWDIITHLSNSNIEFQGLKLSRNRGHQNALIAGLTYSSEFADMMITIDADLQDDIKVMKEFIKHYYNGCDIVYGVRTSRKKDTFFKRKTAQSFYKIMKKMGVETIYNHADYRLMSKRAVNNLLEFKEANLFLRGLVPLIGYKYATVGYERSERLAGVSKYPLKKMLSFAMDGITSFSTKPLKILFTLGMFLFIISSAFNIYFLVDYFIQHFVVRSYSLIIISSLWNVTGILLMAIGLIGEYIGKIYTESKHRPRFFIDEICKKEEE